jgi:hypothetical protein
LFADHTDLAIFAVCSSTATKDQILVPETLLKKRKAQEKSREKSIAELEKRKKVRLYTICWVWMHSVMIIPTTRLDLRVNAVAFLIPSFGAERSG